MGSSCGIPTVALVDEGSANKDILVTDLPKQYRKKAPCCIGFVRVFRDDFTQCAGETDNPDEKIGRRTSFDRRNDVKELCGEEHLAKPAKVNDANQSIYVLPMSFRGTFESAVVQSSYDADHSIVWHYGRYWLETVQGVRARARELCGRAVSVENASAVCADPKGNKELVSVGKYEKNNSSRKPPVTALMGLQLEEKAASGGCSPEVFVDLVNKSSELFRPLAGEGLAIF